MKVVSLNILAVLLTTAGTQVASALQGGNRNLNADSSYTVVEANIECDIHNGVSDTYVLTEPQKGHFTKCIKKAAQKILDRQRHDAIVSSVSPLEDISTRDRKDGTITRKFRSKVVTHSNVPYDEPLDGVWRKRRLNQYEPWVVPSGEHDFNLQVEDVGFVFNSIMNRCLLKGHDVLKDGFITKPNEFMCVCHSAPVLSATPSG
mmetsp:Transcript_12340/g.18782  ORF Transcript_12340/g.18782 Transcript_12340/m.18782 type:complete len:204 (+) Transcript_12340:110-721(+)